MVFSLRKILCYPSGFLGLLVCLWTFPILAAPSANNAAGVYYRYVNEEGIKVLDKSIPPQYAQNGYEILNKGGQVIEVVPPAPTAEQIAREQSQNEIMFHYERLRKRYSSIDAIESARKRRMENLDTSISILGGNISTLQQQLETQMNEAATREREGKTVPVHILDAIANSKAEIAVAEELLTIRQNEKSDINKKFDKDIEYFVKGEALAQQGLATDSLPN
jgi:hypothetical protein